MKYETYVVPEQPVATERGVGARVRPAEEYFNEVYEQTYPRILRYVSTRISGKGAYHDICDVLQETYTEFYRVLREKGEEYARSDLALLYRIADTRLGRKYTQRGKRAQVYSLSIPVQQDGEELFITDFETQPEFLDEDRVIDHVLAEQIVDIIKSGDAQDRDIFILWHEQDMKLSEIASVLHLPLHAVKNKLYRKLNEIKKLLNGGS